MAAPRALCALTLLALAGGACGAAFVATDAERAAGAKLAAAPGDAHRIAALKELVELKNARIADALEVRDKAREGAEEAAKRADSLADQLAVERAATSAAKKEVEAVQAERGKCEAGTAELRGEIEKFKKELAAKADEAEDPKLSNWVSHRFQAVGALVGDEGGGKLFGEAVSGALEGGRQNLDMFEVVVEKRTGLGRFLAALMSALAICLPLYGLGWMCTRVTKALSFRQHLLVGHLFNISVMMIVVAVTLSTGVDPLVTLVRGPLSKVLMCTFFFVQWLCMMLLIAHGGLAAGASWDARRTAAAHLLSYGLLMVHARRRTLPNLLRAADGGWPYVNVRYYVGYAMALAALAALTINAASEGGEDGGFVGEVSGLFEGGMAGLRAEAEKLLGASPRKFRTGRSRRPGSTGNRTPGGSMAELPILAEEEEGVKSS